MNRISLLKAAYVIARLGLGGVFIFAGVLKIIDPAGFALNVANFRLAPHEWINLIAITLPWIEVLAGVLLIAGIWPQASALVIGGMTVVFLGAIGSAVARGLDIECGCFGTVSAKRVGLMSLVFDAVLLAAAIWLVLRPRIDNETANQATGVAASPV